MEPPVTSEITVAYPDVADRHLRIIDDPHQHRAGRAPARGDLTYAQCVFEANPARVMGRSSYCVV